MSQKPIADMDVMWRARRIWQKQMTLASQTIANPGIVTLRLWLRELSHHPSRGRDTRACGRWRKKLQFEAKKMKQQKFDIARLRHNPDTTRTVAE